MKKEMIALALVVVVGFAGCGKKKERIYNEQNDNRIRSELDIPLAENETSEVVTNFFDEEIGDLVLTDDISNDFGTNDLAYDARENDDIQTEVDDFSWIQEPQAQEFKTVYFDFDKATIRADQEDTITYNIEQAQRALAENPDTTITLVVEGHADHAAGSDAYNLALSEKRAKSIKDRFVAAGVSSAAVKIVGRGSEVPAVVDGRIVDGDRTQQWPNRRSEMRMIIG